MKILKLLLVGSMILISTSFQFEEDEVTTYTPLLMTRTELEKSIESQSPKSISEIGKIYTKGQRIYITEKYKGIHIIDNTNPAKPENVGFIRVPGCVDISIKENTLYADNSVDLVAIDIRNFPIILVTERIINVFPEPFPPNAQYISWRFNRKNRPENTVIVGWRKL
jgi:hypothetical protein